MIRVIKLGGSLLTLPDLRERFGGWFATQPKAVNLLIVGGGSAVEALRKQYEIGWLDGDAAHWAAVEAMSENARRLLVEAKVRGQWLERLETLRDLPSGIYALDPVFFLREVDPLLPGGCLPCSWDVTSDTIAARVAVAVTADELAILKSAGPRPGATLDELAGDGFVDPMFPRVAAALNIAWGKLA